MFYGFDNIQDKLMHLNYDFENVNMSLQLFQILYYSFGKSCLYLFGNFLMEPLLLATKHNRIN